MRARVLVVDDSAFARKVVREVLGRCPDLEVVGHARDGLEALEKITELSPDVVTLDLVMPHLDGLGVLRALSSWADAGQVPPRVVVVSISGAESDLALDALANGAVDLVHKPTALATDRLYGLSSDLVTKVRAAAAARWPSPAGTRASTRPPALGPESQATAPVEVVVVGTSTGGPQALTRLLLDLPADFPAPLALALHIPAGYTATLAQRIDRQAALRVQEATDGGALTRGTAVIAPGGQHLRIERDGGVLRTRIGPHPMSAPHRPSVDVLFQSAAEAVGPGVLGVVLTGMGQDGLEGARRIRAAGGRVLTEAEESCIVYGMPRVVWEAGLAAGEAPLDAMGRLLMRAVAR